MSFDIDKTVDYWVESAEYDFEAGKNLLKQDILMKKRTFIKNVRKNLQPIKLMKWTKCING